MMAIFKIYSSIRSHLILRSMKGKMSLGNNVRFSRKFVFKSPKANPNAFSVGSNVYLDGMWVTQHEGRIVIGDNCSFRSGTYVGALVSVSIGNNVFGAENVFIIDNNNHPISPEERLIMSSTPPNSPLWKWSNPAVKSAPVVIEDNVWLGRNAMILKGVTIGEGSIVAAGSVLTKSIPPYSIAAGNPAKVVKVFERNKP